MNKVQNTSSWLILDKYSIDGIMSGDHSSLVCILLVSKIPKIPGMYSETISVNSINSVIPQFSISVTLTVT